MPSERDLALVPVDADFVSNPSPIMPILIMRRPKITISEKKEIATRLCIKNHPCKVLTRVIDFISIYAFFLNLFAKSNSANFVFLVFSRIAFIIR